jgi:hypothetical protein
MKSLYKLLGYPLKKNNQIQHSGVMDPNSFTISKGSSMLDKRFKKKMNLRPKKTSHSALWSTTTGGERPWKPRHAKYMGFRSNRPF